MVATWVSVWDFVLSAVKHVMGRNGSDNAECSPVDSHRCFTFVLFSQLSDFFLALKYCTYSHLLPDYSQRPCCVPPYKDKQEGTSNCCNWEAGAREMCERARDWSEQGSPFSGGCASRSIYCGQKKKGGTACSLHSASFPAHLAWIFGPRMAAGHESTPKPCYVLILS